MATVAINASVRWEAAATVSKTETVWHGTCIRQGYQVVSLQSLQGILGESASPEDFSVVQSVGLHKPPRTVEQANLDVTISVGYRVNWKREGPFTLGRPGA